MEPKPIYVGGKKPFLYDELAKLRRIQENATEGAVGDGTTITGRGTRTDPFVVVTGNSYFPKGW